VAVVRPVEDQVRMGHRVSPVPSCCAGTYGSYASSVSVWLAES
jgi:hypothetical protein